MSQIQKGLYRHLGKIVVELGLVAHSIAPDQLSGEKVGHGIQYNAAASLLAICAFKDDVKVVTLFLI